MSTNILPDKADVWSQLRAWGRRYGASEIAGAFAAYIGYFTVLGMTQNPVASAYGGSIGESLGSLELCSFAKSRLIKPGQSAAWLAMAQGK